MWEQCRRVLIDLTILPVFHNDRKHCLTPDFVTDVYTFLKFMQTFPTFVKKVEDEISEKLDDK